MPRLQSRLCVVFAPFVSQAFPQRTRDNRQTSRSASRNCKCSHIETRDKSPALGATKAIGLTAGRSAGQTHVSPKTMLWMLQFCSEQKIVAKIENNCKPLLLLSSLQSTPSPCIEISIWISWCGASQQCQHPNILFAFKSDHSGRYQAWRDPCKRHWFV